MVKTGEGQWDVAGELPLHTLAELMGEPLQEEGVTTASGLVTRRLGGFPKEGDKLDLGAFELRVEEIDGMRVSRLKLCRKVENPPPASE